MAFDPLADGTAYLPDAEEFFANINGEQSHVSGTVLEPTLTETTTATAPPTAKPIDSGLVPPLIGDGSPAKLTKAAQNLLGRHVPTNPTKCTNVSLRAFSEFWVARNGCFKSTAGGADQLSPKERSQSVDLTRLLLFQNSDGTPFPHDVRAWSTEQKQRINTALIEFIAHRRNTLSGKELSPSTLRGYIAGLQRGFRTQFGFDVDLFNGDVFGDKNSGIVCALDNKIRKLQAEGSVRRSHNFLTEEDIVKLYSSSALSKTHGRGFMTRLIMGVAIMTSMRPGELAGLRLGDVTVSNTGSEPVISIVGTIGDRDGKSKTRKGGLRAVSDKPPAVSIWNRSQLHGLVNVFEDIMEYLNIVTTFREPSSRFFCSVNHRTSNPAKFFMNGNLGVHSFRRYLQDACHVAGVTGTGVVDHMVMHGLRATSITRLFEMGFGDASVALRSGHRDFRSFKAYHNLSGKLGLQQQAALLDGSRDFGAKVGSGGVSHNASGSIAESKNRSSVNDENICSNVTDGENGSSISKRRRVMASDDADGQIQVLRDIGSIVGNVSINIFCDGNGNAIQKPSGPAD